MVARGSISVEQQQEWLEALRHYVKGKPDDNGQVDGFCPVHEGDGKRHKGPSASFNLKMGVWECFTHPDECPRESRSQIRLLVGWLEKGRPSTASSPSKREEKSAEPAKPLPSEATIKRWAAELRKYPKRLGYLTDERGINREVIQEYKVGWDAGSRAYTIPWRDQDGVLVNVKWIRYEELNGDKSVWWVKGRPIGGLWPHDQLSGDGSFIAVCEGDWDALVLISHDIPAVTVPSGGGKGKWRDEWSPRFASRQVAVVGDCDDAGRALADEAATSISAFAKLVWPVELNEERADGYDVSNWFADGGTKDEFRELVKHSPVRQPHRLQVVSAWDRLEHLKNQPPPKWRFRPIFLDGTYGVLAALMKTGKSWDIAAMVVAAASGAPLWGSVQVDVDSDVLYFVGEDDERLTLQRIQAICRWQDLDEREVLSRIHIAEAVPRFGEAGDLDIVRSQLELHPEAKFTAIEPLYLASPGADSRQLFDMAALLGAIQQVVVNEAGSGLIVGHHWNESGRGSGPERMAGAGPAEWGRVLLSGKADEKQLQQDGSMRMGMKYEISGSRIPNMSLDVARYIRQEDSDNPVSPYHYRAEATFTGGVKHALSPTAGEVLSELEYAEDQTARQVEDRVAKRRKRAKAEPPDSRTIRKALNELKEAGLASAKGGVRDRSWRRVVQGVG